MARLATYISDCGGSTAIVALHGVTDNGPSLAGIAQRWNGERRVVLVDSLGHGLSPRLTDAELADPLGASVEAAIDVVEEQAGYAASGKVALLGHSMGGAIATAAAAVRPDLVEALVLEDPAWLTEEQAAAYKAGAQAEIARLDRIAANPADAVRQAVNDHPSRAVGELGAWATAKGQVDRALVAVGVVGLTAPRTQLAAGIAVPCLLMTGDQPGALFTEEEIASILAVGNPLLRATTITGAGHCIRRDQPEAFYRAVEAFLGSLPSSGA